jgi:RNA polymerase sigma factor (sigma-70 family)
VEQAVESGVGRMSDATAHDDRRLLARVAAGDREALAELYARHRRPLYHYLLRLTADAALAEDLLQETFVAAWRAAAGFEGRAAPRTWLIGIARRQAHNVLRRKGADPLDAQTLGDLEAPDGDPENAALAAAERDALVAAIARLSPVHREAIALAFAEGLGAQEIAEVVGVPVNTVKSRLRDAKRALRALLDAERAVGGARPPDAPAKDGR